MACRAMLHSMGIEPGAASGDLPFTVTALAAAIRTRRISAHALAQDILMRCKRQSQLQALIAQDAEAFLAAAHAADRKLAAGQRTGPLHGVPILVKDNIDVVGYPTTAGTPGLDGIFPQRSAPVVQRLLDAGALIAGKANLHELAVGGTSDNRYFGRVVNPWRPELVAGGSSGGCAVAVAARLVPAALGTDTNGSVRGPSALQGIAGFRPSFGRYPYGGTFPGTPTRDSAGPMATTVRDLILLDEVLTGARGDCCEVSLAGLRLGRPGASFFEATDERTQQVFEEAIHLIEAAGGLIIPVELPGLHELAAQVAWPISSYEVVSSVPAFLAGRAPTVTIEAIMEKIASPLVRQRFNPLAADITALERAAQEAMRGHRPRLQRLLAGCFARNRLDALVFPTTPFPAVEVCEDTADIISNGRRVPQGFGRLIHNTVYQSAAGIPSLTVPAGLTVDGLPVGLNFDAPAGADRRLLAIGLAFENLRGVFPSPTTAEPATLA